MTTTQLRSVLVVEDDDDIREIIRESLETIGGLSVNLCGSGIDAFMVLQDEMPDLVLLDWMLPDLDGGAVIQQLRSDPRTAGLPVVVLTGTARRKDVENIYASGAVDVISKPFNPITLASRLAEVFDAAD